ncbi:MAG: MurR/RpiR family transcriptional regulator [Lachnotalea sp.]
MQYFTFPNIDFTCTKAEQKILDFILQSPTDILLLSIHDLSSRLGISKSTISRFARHLGYNDYKELKSDIISQLNESKSPAQKLSQSLIRPDLSTVSGMLQYQQFCLAKTIEHINEDYINEVINSILLANKVYVFGKGVSSNLASLTKFRLLRFGLNIDVLPTGGSEIFEALNFVKSTDFIILFGFQKIPREAQVIIDYRNTIGYKTLLISSHLSQDENNDIDYNLYVYRGEPTEYHSMSAPTALIDALVIKIAACLGDHATECLSSLHQLKEHYKKDVPR